MPAVTSSDGPVAVTGASGYIGSQVVIALMKHGYTVHACVRDLNKAEKTDHLLALNKGDYPGKVNLFMADLLVEGSYDIPFEDCSAVLHVGTPLDVAKTPTGYNVRPVYDGAINGTLNVLNSVKKGGTVKRFIFTSSFAAISHPSKPGYVFTEDDWASDNRENDPKWSKEMIDTSFSVGYAMAKEETEKLAYSFAEKDGRFDVISVNPLVVLGPLLSRLHERPQSWQWLIGQMLEGKTLTRNWDQLWNIVDVRDVGESQALMIESDVCKNGWRYMLCAPDESNEIDALQMQAYLQKLFPYINVAGPPEEINQVIEKYGKVRQRPLAHCDKARNELGLKTHAIEDTLRDTGQTLIDLGLVKPSQK